MIKRYVEIEKHDYVSGPKWHVYYSADVTGSDYMTGVEIEMIDSFMFDSEHAANAAANAWLEMDPVNDDIAIKLTDSFFDYDPYSGADYGEVLKSTLDMMTTPDGWREILSQQIDLFVEATA